MSVPNPFVENESYSVTERLLDSVDGRRSPARDELSENSFIPNLTSILVTSPGPEEALKSPMGARIRGNDILLDPRDAPVSLNTFQRIFLFLVTSFLVGLVPVFVQVMLTDPETGERRATFRPQIPHLIGYTTVIIIASISVSIGKRPGILEREGDSKSASTFLRIMTLSPVSAFTSLSDAIEIPTMKYLDADLRGIVNQIRLPAYAVIRRLLFNAKQTAVQWALIICTSITVAGYIMSRILEPPKEPLHRLTELLNEHTRTPTEIILEFASPATTSVIWGLFLAFSGVSCAMTSGLIAEKLLKSSPFSFWLDLLHTRLSALVFVSLLLAVHAFVDGELSMAGVFNGITKEVVFMGIWLAMRDIVFIALLKYLNTFWTALANVAALCVTFLAYALFLQRTFPVLPAFFVAIVICLLIAYTLTKLEQRQQQRKEAFWAKN